MGDRTRHLGLNKFRVFLNLVKKESVWVGGVVVEGKRVNKEKANELQKRKHR